MKNPDDFVLDGDFVKTSDTTFAAILLTQGFVFLTPETEQQHSGRVYFRLRGPNTKAKRLYEMYCAEPDSRRLTWALLRHVFGIRKRLANQLKPGVERNPFCFQPYSPQTAKPLCVQSFQ